MPLGRCMASMAGCPHDDGPWLYVYLARKVVATTLNSGCWRMAVRVAPRL